MIPGMNRLNGHGLLVSLLLVAGCSAPGPTPADGSAGATPATPGAQAPPADRPAAVPEPDTEPAAPVGSIEIEELFTLVDAGEVLVLDVRPPLFQRLGRIPGSVSLPRKKYDELIGAEEARIRGAAEAGRDIVLYCANIECPDASAVAARLARRGYPVRVYHGGWDQWKAAGLPTG
jgi:rhodanese-related sulfurtransferase